MKYNFNEGKGDVIKDISGHGYNAVMHGGKWVKGISGYGVRLNGQNEYIKLHLNINWSKMTIVIWFKPKALRNSNPRIICNSHTDIDNEGFQLGFDNGGGVEWVNIGNGRDYASIKSYEQLGVDK